MQQIHQLLHYNARILCSYDLHYNEDRYASELKGLMNSVYLLGRKLISVQKCKSIVDTVFECYFFLHCNIHVLHETLEIGSLGHYQKEMRPLLSSPLDLPKGPTRDLLDRCAKAAISCSYQIFVTRNSPSYNYFIYSFFSC